MLSRKGQKKKIAYLGQWADETGVDRGIVLSITFVNGGTKKEAHRGRKGWEKGKTAYCHRKPASSRKWTKGDEHENLIFTPGTNKKRGRCDLKGSTRRKVGRVLAEGREGDHFVVCSAAIKKRGSGAGK